MREKFNYQNSALGTLKFCCRKIPQIIQSDLPRSNKLVANAGFAEMGETIEDTVKREVAEEVGVGVKAVRYVGSQVKL